MSLDLTSLNDVQREAVLHTEGACLVSAGAGSGKTRVLTYRVANLITNHNVDPRNILAITFTNKAASEMKERICSMLGNKNLTICTFHALGVKILRESYKYIYPRDKFFSIYDEDDKKKLIKAIVKEIDKDDKMYQTYSDYISSAKNKGVHPENYSAIYGNQQLSQMVEKVYTEYEKQMEKNNAYDFDDLLCKTYELIINNESVRRIYTEKFHYILVDEFQDTNDIQYDLLRVLQSKYHNIFVVGDEDQSIYSWRGADSKNIAKFIRDYNCKQIFKLEQNYRSTDKILNAANKIISKNTDRLDKKLWTDKINGNEIEYHFSESDKLEGEYVARKIYSLINYGGQYRDVAILCRMNALTRVFEEKLLNYNIPYRIYGGVKFYDRAEVKNILAYLRCIVNEKDDQSFERIINFPKRKIGEVALSNLKELGAGRSYMETLLSLNDFSDMKKSTLAIYLKVKDLFIELKRLSETVSITVLVVKLLNMIDVESIYDKSDDEEYSRLLNIRELVSAIKEFEKQNPEATLEDYLQSVTLIADIDTYESQEECVTIATIHAVKGLEFKDVFIVGLEEGIFPLERSDSNYTKDETEEERRLMYVAITRAKERLYLTHCDYRFMYGRTTQNDPSRYLKDLGYIKRNDRPVSFDAYDDEDDYRDYYGYRRNGYGYGNYSGNNRYNSGNLYNSNNSYNYKNINNNNEYNENNSNYYGGGVKGGDIKTGMTLYNTSVNGVRTSRSDISGNTSDSKEKNYTTGQTVRHSKFGEGVVISFDSTKHIIQIAFKGFGVKILDSNIAVLEIVD